MARTSNRRGGGSRRATRSRSSSSRGNGGGSDVVMLLKKDHADVKKLFKQFEQTEDDGEKERIARQICQMLTVHATCEEELVYPAAREVLDDEELSSKIVPRYKEFRRRLRTIKVRPIPK